MVRSPQTQMKQEVSPAGGPGGSKAWQTRLGRYMQVSRSANFRQESCNASRGSSLWTVLEVERSSPGMVTGQLAEIEKNDFPPDVFAAPLPHCGVRRGNPSGSLD